MPQISLPPGFKFQPTDKELVLVYLSTKVQGESLADDYIKFSDDVYKKPPSEFCTDSTALYGHDNIAKHYFFTNLRRFNQNVERKVGSCGFWDGKSKKIDIVDNNNVTIGYKRTLNFIAFEGECKHKKKTEWLMHEFCLKRPPSERTNLVVCVFQNQKKDEEKGYGSRLVLGVGSGSGSGSGYGGRLKITSVESFVNPSPRSFFDNPDLFDGVYAFSLFDVATADSERWTGGLNDQLADDTDPQFDPMSFFDSTTTANENPCPAPNEEIKQSMNMHPNPQFDNGLFNVHSGFIHPTLPNEDAPIYSPEYDDVTFMDSRGFL